MWRGREIRVGPQGTLVARSGLIEPAFLLQQSSQIIMRDGPIRVDRCDSLIAGDRLRLPIPIGGGVGQVSQKLDGIGL